jgi:hypothetical protein
MSPAGDYYNRMVLGLIKDYEGNLHSFQVNRILKKTLVLKRRCHKNCNESVSPKILMSYFDHNSSILLN